LRSGDNKTTNLLRSEAALSDPDTGDAHELAASQRKRATDYENVAYGAKLRRGIRTGGPEFSVWEGFS
jgi:hypothetical protein